MPASGGALGCDARRMAVAGVFQAQSGQPFTVLTGVDSNGNGAGGDRPTCPGGRLTPDPETGNLRTFTTAGCSSCRWPQRPAARLEPRQRQSRPEHAAGAGGVQLGPEPREALPVAGRHTLTFRADVFNLFNQDNYGVPINSLEQPELRPERQQLGEPLDAVQP